MAPGKSDGKRNQTVRYALLGLLAQRPLHGYELRDALGTLIGPQWTINSGQIYTTLARLEADGFVTHSVEAGAGGPDRNVFELSAAGIAALHVWLAERPVSRDYLMRDEVYVKLVLGLLSERALALRTIHSQRRYLYRELGALTRQRTASEQQRDIARLLLLDNAAMHLEADLRWLEMCEARLDDMQRATAARVQTLAQTQESRVSARRIMTGNPEAEPA